MMVLVDTSYCSSNTTRRRMDLSARQKNTSCNDDMKTPASKRSTKYHMCYGQIRYLMKRLSTALDSKIKQGRPPKYCRMCHRELRKLIGNQLERMPLEKKCMKGRNIMEQRCDKKRIYLLQKRAAKQENAVLSQVLQQKKYMQIIRQSRKCHIFVRNIDKTVDFYVTTSIKDTIKKKLFINQNDFNGSTSVSKV